VRILMKISHGVSLEIVANIEQQKDYHLAGLTNQLSYTDTNHNKNK
jgi:hypothetical protein